MAVAIVEEYAELATNSKGFEMAVPGRLLTSQTVTYTTSAATTNAFGSSTRFVFIQTVDTQAFVKFGSSPTAAVAAGNQLVPAGGGRFFGVNPSVPTKVALYDGSS